MGSHTLFNALMIAWPWHCLEGRKVDVFDFSLILNLLVNFGPMQKHYSIVQPKLDVVNQDRLLLMKCFVQSYYQNYAYNCPVK